MPNSWMLHPNGLADAKRVLVCAVTASYVNDRLAACMRLFRQNGWKIDVAASADANLDGVERLFDIPFSPTPYAAQSFAAYRRLTSIFAEQHYDVIFCAQSASAAVTRLAARSARRSGSKLVYALFDGFPFYKGAPSKTWQAYYPLEKRFAQETDLIIATNQEDFTRAKDRRFAHCACAKIHGTGIDVDRFHPVSLGEKMALRQKLGINPHERVLICTNRWEERHNHRMLIHGLATAEERDHRLRLYFLGDAPRMQKLKAYVEAKKIRHWVRFPGHCDNVEEWLQASDVALSASERVGQARGLLEAMACGLPVVASEIRGHSDLIVNGRSGHLFQIDDVGVLAKAIFSSLAHADEIGESAREMAEMFSYASVQRELADALSQLTGHSFQRGVAPKTRTDPDFIAAQHAMR